MGSAMGPAWAFLVSSTSFLFLLGFAFLHYALVPLWQARVPPFVAELRPCRVFASLSNLALPPRGYTRSRCWTRWR